MIKWSIFMSIPPVVPESASTRESSPLNATSATTSVSRNLIPPSTAPVNDIATVIIPHLITKLPLSDAQLIQCKKEEFKPRESKSPNELGCAPHLIHSCFVHPGFPALLFQRVDLSEGTAMSKSVDLCARLIKENNLTCITVPKHQVIDNQTIFVTEEPEEGCLNPIQSEENLERLYTKMKSFPELQEEVNEFFRQLAKLSILSGKLIHPINGALKTNPCHLTLFGFYTKLNSKLGCSNLIDWLLDWAPPEAWNTIIGVAKEHKYPISFRVSHEAKQSRREELAARAVARQWHFANGITHVAEKITYPAGQELSVRIAAVSGGSSKHKKEILDTIHYHIKRENYQFSVGSLVNQRSVGYAVSEGDKQNFESTLKVLQENSIICSWHRRIPNEYEIYF
jgi:hypothetical protein